MTAHGASRGARDLPDAIALFPLAGALLLPGGQLPLKIFEPRYLRMVDDALGASRIIGMIQPRDVGDDDAPPLYAVGCGGRITAFAESGDGRYFITLTGLRRFAVRRELNVDSPYRQALVDWRRFAGDGGPDPTALTVDRERLERAMRRYLAAEGLNADWDAVSSAPTDGLVASLAMSCPFAPNEKQALLEAEDIAARARCLIALMEMTSVSDQGGDAPLQ